MLIDIHAPNCEGCSPRPAVIYARDKEHALKMIKKARRIFVCCYLAKYRRYVFVTTKREALSEVSRLKDGYKPFVNMHLPDAVFIGE